MLKFVYFTLIYQLPLVNSAPVGLVWTSSSSHLQNGAGLVHEGPAGDMWIQLLVSTALIHT